MYIVTSNKNKAESIKTGLAQYGIKVKHFALEIPEPRSYNIKEIAEAKSVYSYKKLKKPCIALDSGFFVHSINGFPRTFVNFALDVIGIEGILKLAENKKRSCDFRDCLAYYDGIIAKPLVFESKVEGSISETQKGTLRPFHWSKLFLIFIPKGRKKTLAQMDVKEYNDWYEDINKNSYMSKFASWFLEDSTD